MQVPQLALRGRSCLSQHHRSSQDGCCLPAVEETAALQVASGGSAALVERLQGEGRFQDAFAFAAAAGMSSHRSDGARIPAAAVLATIKAARGVDGSAGGLRLNVSCHR